MAPSREVKLPEIPDTLPEDFAEWDGGDPQPQAPAPVKQTPVQSVRPAETRVPAATRVLVSDMEVERSMPQPVVRAPKPAPPPAARATVEQTWQPTPRARQQSAPAQPDFAPSATQRAAEAKIAEALWPEAEQKKAKSEPGQSNRRPLVLAGAAALCIGLAAGGSLYFYRSHSQPKPQAPTETTMANVSEPAATTPDGKPDPRNATAGTANPQSSAQQPSQGSQQNAQQAAADNTPQETQPQNPTPNVNMAQFTSASSIPRGQQGGSAPEPGELDASHMGGGNSGMPFSPSNKEHVQFAPSKPIEVAAGALTSSLIKRTMPVYPEIARNSHVSGVVTVAITITPQGTVAEAHAVSGPVLLRPAAVDAVKNWRFRPYLVNNHPVPVQSNVNVDFALQ